MTPALARAISFFPYPQLFLREESTCVFEQALGEPAQRALARAV